MSVIAGRNPSRYEPGLFLAAVLALLVHVIFAGFMLFGLNWETQPPEGMMVDLWHVLPPPVQPIVEQLPVKTEPKQTEPEQSVQKESPQPPKITSPSPPKKPEIIRPTKKEEPEPVVEKASAEKKQQQNELEKQREKEAAEKAEALQRQQEQAQEKQREQEALAAQREAQQAAERARIMDEIAKFKAMILAKVRSRIVMPPDLPGNPMVEFGVTLLPGGDILNVQLRQSSRYAAFDSAVERAIFLAQPLPLPPNPELFREFRNLNITVHYQE